MNDAEKLKWIAYCRKSTEQEDKQTLSIDAQKREIKTLCERRGLELTGLLWESYTAYKTGRVEFEKMLARIENGVANAIVVYHLSRLARNTADGGRIIYLMDEGKLKEICTPTKSYINNPDDKFFLQIEFGMNKKSSDDTSTYVKRDIGSKLLRGEYPSYAINGYLNLDKEGRITGKNFDSKKQIMLEALSKKLDRKLMRVEKDPVCAPILRQFFDEVLKGEKNLRELVEYANEIGVASRRFGRKMNKSQIERILTNPFYHGVIRFRGELHQGIHEPIITKQEFDRIQDALHSRSRPRPKRIDFAFRGLMKCGVCNMSIVGWHKVKKISGKEYTYYTCSKRHGNCGQPCIREDELERQIEERLKAIIISERLWKVCVKLLKESYGDQIQRQEQQKKSWEHQARVVQDKIKRLLDLRIDGGVSDEDYRMKREELMAEKQRLEELVVSANKNNTDWIKRAEGFFEGAHKVYELFKKGDLAEKKRLVGTIGVNLTLRDKKLHWEYKAPYQFLIMPTGAVGTQENRATMQKVTSLSEEMTLWRAGRDLNP